jgi:hypothetical protein
MEKLCANAAIAIGLKLIAVAVIATTIPASSAFTAGAS